MSEVLDLEPEPKLDTAGKRARIETELRENPQRSNHAIARAVGHSICHKTVAAARERLGSATLGNSPTEPTPTERRHMLIEGCKDFDAKYPPGPAEVATAEEAVDVALAKGIVSLDPKMAKVVQGAVDQCRGATLRNREARQAQDDSVGEKNGERVLLMPRKEVTIQHDDDLGEWIIRQRNWPDEDAVIIIDDGDIHPFIDILTDYLGYGRVP